MKNSNKTSFPVRGTVPIMWWNLYRVSG